MLFLLRAAAVAVIVCAAPLVHAQAPTSATTEKAAATKKAAAPDTARRAPRELSIAYNAWTGDFEKMLDRLLIRIAAPYSRTLYFNDKGRERGLSAEFVRDFEIYLNNKYKKRLQGRPITLVIAAVTRDKLLPGLTNGLFDIAVGNLTITDDRLATVDMVAISKSAIVHEVLVTGPRSPAIASLDDLAGKTVHVRRTSSYYGSLVALNERFRGTGKEEVNIVLVPDGLEDEDMMEMVSTGVLQAIVVDDWLAKMWAQVFPTASVHENIVLHEDGCIGWAFRKGSPQLAAELQKFYDASDKKGVIPYRTQQYAKRVKQLKDPTQGEEWKRFQATVALFEKYGHQYAFDPLMLTAQGFQESQLDQAARSHVGAIGVMQLMPTTGASMKVGDIKNIEPNVHAGAKYMDHLMATYFKDAHFTEQDRTLFAFASYNAGPAKISKARTQAAKRGLDPDRWLNNVEVIVGQRVGMETTTYVRNIYKYYVAYKLVIEAQRHADTAKSSVAAPP